MRKYRETILPYAALVLVWTICNLLFENELVMSALKIIVFGGIVLVFSKYIFKSSFSLKSEFKRPDKKELLKFAAGILLLFAVLVVSGYRTTGRFMDFDFKKLSVISLISTVLTAPVMEEIYFRGYMRFAHIKESGKTANSSLCILINCAAFVLIHYPKYFSSAMSGTEILSSSITLGMLSYLFILIRNETDNILFPILLHAFWNLGTVLIL